MEQFRASFDAIVLMALDDDVDYLLRNYHTHSTSILDDVATIVSRSARMNDISQPNMLLVFY